VPECHQKAHSRSAAELLLLGDRLPDHPERAGEPDHQNRDSGPLCERLLRGSPLIQPLLFRQASSSSSTPVDPPPLFSDPSCTLTIPGDRPPQDGHEDPPSEKPDADEELRPVHLLIIGAEEPSRESARTTDRLGQRSGMSPAAQPLRGRAPEPSASHECCGQSSEAEDGNHEARAIVLSPLSAVEGLWIGNGGVPRAASGARRPA
jgi:hypothetical protein